jgi:Ca-activated chloride channel homolog
MPKLWATRKVGTLTRQLKLEGNNPRLLEELRETALQYGIITEYTSYLVQEEGIGGPPPVVATGRVSGNAVAVAPQAAAASGKQAVVRAEAARRAGEARSLAAADAAVEIAEADFTGGSANRRVVAGRTFELKNNVWTDVRSTGKNEMVNIEPFSHAYFAVLRALPELKPAWSAMPSNVVAGKRVAIALKSGGRRNLSQAEINNLVAKFRK